MTQRCEDRVTVCCFQSRLESYICTTFHSRSIDICVFLNVYKWTMKHYFKKCDGWVVSASASSSQGLRFKNLAHRSAILTEIFTRSSLVILSTRCKAEFLAPRHGLPFSWISSLHLSAWYHRHHTCILPH